MGKRFHFSVFFLDEATDDLDMFMVMEHKIGSNMNGQSVINNKSKYRISKFPSSCLSQRTLHTVYTIAWYSACALDLATEI